MDGREMRGMVIAATSRLRRSKAGWIVPSQSIGTRNYQVTSDLPGALGLTCTCPDYELRGLPCKHIIAVEITTKRETPEGDVLTETVRVTYTQDWSAYNAAQCEEKERFMPMLADLCGSLQRPYKGRGRPALPMSDMAFAVHQPGLLRFVSPTFRQ